jgi:hypothetical protein
VSDELSARDYDSRTFTTGELTMSNVIGLDGQPVAVARRKAKRQPAVIDPRLAERIREADTTKTLDWFGATFPVDETEFQTKRIIDYDGFLCDAIAILKAEREHYREGQ